MDELVHHFDATLRDGRAVHLRAMHPGDEAELVQAFERSRKCGFATFLDPRGGRSAAASFPAKGIAGLATLLLEDAARRRPRRRSQPASSGP